MRRLVLLRHGESQWNLENRFTGWTDIDLSENGIRQAENAGIALRQHGFAFDVAYTSVLKRAIRTLWIVLAEMDLMWLPVSKYWRLNERHYGALQGLKKAETKKKFGEEQVFSWRRSYDIQPPPIERIDDRFPGTDPRYQGLRENDLPLTESLKDTLERLLPLWNKTIAPALLSGKTVLIAAHGNSLRALVKYLDKIGDDEIGELNIPTGEPLVYHLDDALKKVESYYLAER